MTLILALGNREQFIQVSDRRLTSNSALVDDESNKAIILRCVDARLLIGFTGLARAGSFETERWLLETLTNCGYPDYTAYGFIERLKEHATNDFNNLPELKRLRAQDKRLSILCTGYLYRKAPPSPLMGSAILTNYQDFSSGKDSSEARDHFEVWYNSEKPEAEGYIDYIQRIGAWQAMTHSDEETLRQMLIEGKPAQAIRDKAVELMREMANRDTAEGLIGSQLSSVILPRNPDSSAISNYHSTTISSTAYLPSEIVALGNGLPAIARRDVHLSFKPEDISNAYPLVVPKVRQNQPCPCGSDKKYKRCHGSTKKLSV